MFSAPTAIRVLKKQPVELMHRHDVSSLKALYLAGEPLDESTSAWIAGELGVPVIDNYWQTETGWPILSIARTLDDRPTRLGSPGVPMPGYKVKVISEVRGEECVPEEKGVLAIEAPLPPGCMQTVYNDDERFLRTYWSNFRRPLYCKWSFNDVYQVAFQSRMMCPPVMEVDTHGREQSQVESRSSRPRRPKLL
jgi:propionyl-CoA synthetase